jgi:hypothetical protein
LVFSLKLARLTFRQRRKARILRRKLKDSESRVLLLTEQSELWRRKCESLYAEFTDKLLDMCGTSAVKFLPEAVRLNELTDKAFSKPVQTVKVYDTLTLDEKSAYDDRFANHRQRGLELGRSDAEILRLWQDHEEEEVASIQEESFIAG